MTTDAILVATDGSDHATRTVERAVELAHDCGATLHAIRVVDVRALDSAPHRERMAAAARDSLEAVERRAAEADLPVVTVVRDGIPHEEILEYAEDADVDVVVVGSYGQGGLQRLLLGSTADRVIRLATVPVMLVPDPEPNPEVRQH
jgi:nucleotide-binding universal stress UspA family protein